MMTLHKIFDAPGLYFRSQDSIPWNKSKLSLKLDTLKRTLGSGKLLLFRILKRHRRQNLYARCKLGMFYVNMLTFQFLPEAFRNNKFFTFKSVYKVIVYKSCDELKVTWSRKQILKFSFEPKIERFFFVFLS